MESVARFLVASTDLLEAEGRVFKRTAVRLSLAAGIALVALVLVLIGIGFATFGVFVLLSHLLHSSWGAALVFAAIALGGATAALLAAKRYVTA